jgi:hypothetical protein
MKALPEAPETMEQSAKMKRPGAKPGLKVLA